MRALGLIALVVASGCASGVRGTPVCVSDDQCPSSQLCFAEGCGDPGKGIVVEVGGGSVNGQFARDFPLEGGTLGASQSFDLGAPLTFTGEFQRDRSAVSNPLDRTFYSEPVELRAVGKSDLLPGVARSFEARFSTTERGLFEMKVGAGSYLLTAMPGDRTVPPVTAEVSVGSDGGTKPSVTFVFPSVDGAPALTGQLIKKLDTTTAPPEPVLISTAYTITGTPPPAIELQLFDVENNPLSQRFPISNSSGEFAVTVSPAARSKPRLIVVASPRDPGVEIPTKRFVLDAQFSSAITLEYGDYGDPAEVKGTVLDASGAPVSEAQVVIEGTVVGDGTFRSKVVETDLSGQFVVRSLPSKNTGSFSVFVVPPKGSRAAYSRRAATVTVKKEATGAISGTLSPATFTLDDRLLVKGLVKRPDGTVAGGVQVRATLQQELTTGAEGSSRELPVEPADTVTLPDGTFELPLDPGVWRFEYTPGGQLPLSSRLVRLETQIDLQTGEKIRERKLDDVSLSFGRTVSGSVTGDMGTLTRQPVPYSRLRFFRVTTVEGRPASILLGSAIADERGRFEVVLPTRATEEK